MTFNWTDGPELSILLVRENGRDAEAALERLLAADFA